MSEHRCRDCHFYRFYPPAIHGDAGECHAAPPVRLPRMFDEKATAGNRVRDETLIWGWPSVSRDDWCGNWSPKEARAH